MNSDGNTKRVLVIDDDYPLLRLVQIMLKKIECSVVPVLSSVEARKQISANDRFDLIILDLMMPEENGFDFLKWKDGQDESIRLIPVIVVTAKNLNDEERAFLGERTETVVQKGLNYAENLIREVNSVFSSQILSSNCPGRTDKSSPYSTQVLPQIPV